MSNKFIFFLIIGSMFITIESSCDTQGHSGVSIGLSEARTRKVFVAEYQVHPNPYMINDTLKIKIQHVWLEHQWSYGSVRSETQIDSGKYQIVIDTEAKILETYGSSWTIGIDGNHYLRSCGRACLISDFDELPADTVKWLVQSGWKLDPDSKKTIIGSFVIQKK